jgi:hypothetical protein
VFEREAEAADSTGHGRRPLYPVSRVHLDAMSTETGIWQHARGAEPDREFGFCTDDVARALVVDVLHSRELGWPAVDVSARRSLRFLREAYDHASERFLNFRDADGRWLDMPASEDCHARALVGLAAVMAEIAPTELADQARQLFLRALPAALTFTAPRALSAAVLACESLTDAGLGVVAGPAFDRLATGLADIFGEPRAGWLWYEPVVTYENAIIPRALVAAGVHLGRPELLERGCATLDWLIGSQVGESGSFSPIGNKTWWPQGRERSRFDQQPIEAATMVAAAAGAFRATGRGNYLHAAETAYGWFLGDNDLGLAMAIPASGGCRDGLTPLGPNMNQGGESTLMWLTALEQIRGLRRFIDAGHMPVVLTMPSIDGTTPR